MKTFLSLTAAAALVAAAAPALAGDLEVELTGVKAHGGDIYATLSTKETFMRAGSKVERTKPADGKVVLRFTDLPAGEYTFMAYHDENGDGQMQMSPMGMPGEGWAMLNAEKLMGPPDFETLKFTVPAEGARIQVPVYYVSGGQ